jgi:putative Holliday junction resolvase
MPNQTINKVIGFDYGKQRTGIASGQTITNTATPLTTLNQIEGNPDWDGIKDQIEQWQPDALIIGVPYQLDGTTSTMTKAALHFGDCLKKRFKLPVFEINEALSSYEAEGTLKQSKKITQQNKHEVDKIAAAVIVQSWLDQH